MPSAFANKLNSGVLNPKLDDDGGLAEEQRSCFVVAVGKLACRRCMINNNALQKKEETMPSLEVKATTSSP